jgi:hypothetical protein
MNRALDWLIGACVALALIAYALILTVSGQSGRHNPPPEGEDDTTPKP